MFRGSGVLAPGAVTYSGVNGSVPFVLAKSGSAVNTPADTTEDILATINVPANAIGVNGAVRVTVKYSHTNSANTKTVRIRLGGIGGTIYFAAATTAATTGYGYATIWNRAAANSQTGFGVGFTDAAVAYLSGNLTGAIDTSAATTIVITGQKATAGETLTLEAYLVEIIL